MELSGHSCTLSQLVSSCQKGFLTCDVFFLFHSSEVKRPWSREPVEHDLTYRVPFATRRRVQHQEEPYHNQEPDSAQVFQEQPESFQQVISRLSTIVRSPTETVKTFSRFVHLSVLLLVIKTAVLVLCMWKNERQSGYQMLSFNAGCTHLLLLYFLCMHLPPPHPTAFLVCIMS